jgi:hypothetical protein
MAKRKRKMTLFDVMHTGQSVGLQVRTRVQPHHPTPELPVMKKLSKLFGRTSRKPDASRPTSAADELAQLRRELAVKTDAPTTNAEPIADEPAHLPEPVGSFRTAEPIAQAFSPRNEEPREEPRAPREPRRSLADILSARWAIVAPKFEAIGVQLGSLGRRGGHHAGQGLLALRELYSRYAVTAAAAIGVVVLLCGSFYAGKLLFNRPAVNLSGQGTALAGNEIRPDVLDINDRNATHANEPIANLDAGQPQATLERQAGPASTAKPGVFGGRRTDLNYVIIQSYPTQAEALATIDVLSKYNIKATVELNLPRWASAGNTLYSVVSVEGYQKLTGNDAYKAYVANIAKISEKEVGKTLPKKLEPGVYKWAPATP